MIKFWLMGKTEILAELPKLSSRDRSEIRAHLWRLRAAEGSNETEKHLRNEAQADSDTNWAAGASWDEVEARLLSGE
jgi:hypothetical protein